MLKDGQVSGSLATMVKLKTPADGVPESTPADERVSPVGSVPDTTLNVYGPVLPLAVNV